MFKIALCDNETCFSKQIENIIKGYYSENRVLFEFYTFTSGVDLIKYIKNFKRFDLIYLDIEMPELNGIEVAKIIRNDMADNLTEIIYVTSKDIYDRELFQVQPLGVIEKPIINNNEIVKYLELALKRTSNEYKFFAYKIKETNYKILLNDIMYFTSSGRSVTLTSKNSKITFYSNMLEISYCLPQPHFLQVQRSYIVNCDYILSFNRNELFMEDGKRISIGKSNRKFVRQILLANDRRRHL